ncbi:MAG: type II secretion system F family protein [Phycisphaerae bacterium]|nr:type II secretion system F family protein [Gemmatimonadaceae bacterium]
MSRGRANARYGYRAANESGAVVEGEVEAGSEQMAIDMLRRRALWATDVWPKQPVRKTRESRGVPPGALATITRALSALLTSGVTLEQALSYASKQSQGAELREAFALVRDDVRNGRSLSEAFETQRVFPALFSALARTGEATGTLDKALDRLAEHLERTDELRARMRSALLYPALLGVAAIFGVTVIMLVVVPRFAVLLQQAGSDIPTSTRILLATSRAATAGWPVLLILALIAVVSWRQWIRVPENRRRWHGSRIDWPVWGPLERATSAARYTRTFALAVPSGVDLLSAMSLSRGTVHNLAIAAELQEAETAVRGGASLSSSVSRVLPPLAVQLLSAGEASGSLGPLSGRAADALESQVQQSLTRAVTLIEPVLILAFGGLIGFVALGLLQAIYGMNASTM